MLIPEGTEKLIRKDYKKALRIITGAFMDYPFPGSLIQSERLRRIVLAEMMGLDLRRSISRDMVLTLSGDFHEVSVWRDSCKTPSNLSYIPYVHLSAVRMLYAMNGREIKNFTIILDEIMKRRAALNLPENTAELALLAVEPEFQGQGRAGKLIRAGLKALDTEEKACFLTTNYRKNTDIYMKYGFKLIDVAEHSRLDMKTYFMLRENI